MRMFLLCSKIVKASSHITLTCETLFMVCCRNVSVNERLFVQGVYHVKEIFVKVSGRNYPVLGTVVYRI